MKQMEKTVANLISEYDCIMKQKGNSPEWAVHNEKGELIKCTVPFVGKEYFQQPKKILVYASAENLSWYVADKDKGGNGEWLCNEQAINRHRLFFESEKSEEGDFEFPHVHLQPMNNGCLATAVYYIANQLFDVKSCLPRAFYETIAFGNYGKYSIETQKQIHARMGLGHEGSKKNIDYVGKKAFLEVSHEYVAADLKELNPDYIIIPKSIYDTDKNFIDSIAGNAVIIPIYQINTRVINIYIARNFPSYDIERLPVAVRTWYEALKKDGMTGISKKNYLTVFSHLDSVLEKVKK